MLLFMYGLPGSGKGTQSAFLTKDYGYIHISTGDLLRDIIANKRERWEELDGYLKAGALVPDTLINSLFVNYLRNKGTDNNFIIDGYPRTLTQLDLVEKEMTAKEGFKTLHIYLECNEKVIIDRIASRRTCKGCGAIYNISLDKELLKCKSCGGELYQRDDDSPATVRKRLDEYKNKTLPIIERLQAEKKLTTLNGDRDPVVIYQDIKLILRDEGV